MIAELRYRRILNIEPPNLPVRNQAVRKTRLHKSSTCLYSISCVVLWRTSSREVRSGEFSVLDLQANSQSRCLQAWPPHYINLLERRRSVTSVSYQRPKNVGVRFQWRLLRASCAHGINVRKSNHWDQRRHYRTFCATSIYSGQTS